MTSTRSAVAVIGLVLAALVTAISVQAVAPRSAIQYAGLVLKKLDPLNPPSYPTEFFTPPPSEGDQGGRERLTDDVAAAVLIMAIPDATADEYCPPIGDILVLAAGSNTYFDISRTSNPALEDFLRDG